MERWRWHEERRKGPAERENGKGAGGGFDGFEEEWRYSSVIVGHESRFTQISNRLCTMFLIDSNLFTGSGSGVVLLPHSKGLGILGISRLFLNDRTGSLRTKTDFLWGETQTANVNLRMCQLPSVYYLFLPLQSHIFISHRCWLCSIIM